MDLRFAWQAGRLATSTFVTHGAYRTGLGRVARLGRLGCPGLPRHFCVAGVALGDMDFPFEWQEGLATSTFALRGMRGAFGTGLGLVVTSTCVLTGRRDIDLRFGYWAGWCGALRSAWSPRTPRHFCMAGVALGHVDLRFAWQRWCLATSAFVLRGRRGTHDAWLGRVARLGPLARPGCRGTFAWRAWRLATSIVFARHAWRHRPLLTLGWVVCRAAWRLATWTFVLRGRRGAW